eukprot:scaffold317188_cov19-Tisochrysis_lutea.AAC.2
MEIPCSTPLLLLQGTPPVPPPLRISSRAYSARCCCHRAAVAGGGVLRDHLGEPEGADFRDAHWWSGNHAQGPQPAQVCPQGAVLGADHPAAHQVQDDALLLQVCACV